MRGLVVLIALCLTLVACTNNPASRAKELAAQVQVGTTTKAEVLQAFGFPAKQKKATPDAQEVWTYVFAGQGDTPSRGLAITFDAAGVVSSISPETQVGPAGSSERSFAPVDKSKKQGPR